MSNKTQTNKMTTIMTDNAHLHEQLNNIRALINDAQNKIEQGEVIDLSGLNLKVQDICRDVLALPAEQAKEFKDTMLEIISTLNTLEESLKSFHNEMQSTKEKLT